MSKQPIAPGPRRIAAAAALVLAVALGHGLMLEAWSGAEPRMAVPQPRLTVRVRQIERVAKAAAPAAAPTLGLARAGPDSAAARVPTPATATAPMRPAATRRTPEAGPGPSAGTPPAKRAQAAADAGASAVAATSASAPAADRDPAAALPVYATQAPAERVLRYRATQANDQGDATLAWARTEAGYTAALTVTLDNGRPLLAWRSEGRLDRHGIAPQRALEQRRRRPTRGAEFEREQQRIVFPAAAAEAPLAAGAQDRLSWIAQLAAIGQADARQLAPGRRVVLQVALAGGSAEPWSFEVVDSGPLVHLYKAPVRSYDSAWHVWLDPALDWWPRRLTQGWPPSALLLELDLAE